jgi:hypothetical protein
MSRFFRENDQNPVESNKWLKKLQQESWELELLVSGFSILLLAKGIEWLTGIQEYFTVSLNFSIQISNIIIVFLAIVNLAVHALILNLVVHLVFRGFWVGIVGLGSVAPNADFHKLKYSNFFVEKLKNRVTTLDDLVILVDRISSIVFAFAFLVIFLLISIALYFTGLVFIGTIGESFVELFSGGLAKIIAFIVNSVVNIYLIFGIIYLIDFLSFGLIKRIKFFSKIYYPFYLFFGWITLAFIYRTIYYNLVSRFSKRRTAYILIPYLLLLVTIPGIKLDHHIYYPDRQNEYSFNGSFYENERKDNDEFTISIPSFIIKEAFLPVFIKYDPNDNPVIKKICPDYTPEKKEGLNSGIRIRKNEDGGYHLSHSTRISESFPEKSLECLKSCYKIELNGILVENEYYFRSLNDNKGLFTIIDIDTLPRGKNELIIFRKEISNDSINQVEYAKVPFWIQKK